MVKTVLGGPFSLDVSWDLPNDPNGVITYYNIYCVVYQDSNMGSGDATVVDSLTAISNNNVIMSSQMNTTVTSLVPFTNYLCYASANTSVGEGSVSTPVSGTTDEYSKTSVVPINKHQ